MIECKEKRTGKDGDLCKWPDCTCIEDNHAAALVPINTAFEPKETVAITLRIRDDGVMIIAAPPNLPPGYYRARLVKDVEPKPERDWTLDRKLSEK